MHSSDSAATGRSLAGVARGACRALVAQASAMMRCMVIALAAVAQVASALSANYLGADQWILLAVELELDASLHHSLRRFRAALLSDKEPLTILEII